MPPRKGRLETYLWDRGDEVSSEIANDFYDSQRPVAPYAVLIPVAAHQDANRIVPAMAEYASQEDCQAFTIFMLLNSPAGEDAGDASVAEVARAKSLYPEIDIRTAHMQYADPVIGQIRKDLWDGAARVALTDGIYDQAGGEFFGINHDIDTEKMSKHYIRNIQSYYNAMQAERTEEGIGEMPLPSRLTQVKHAYPFATHPNIARAIFWSDITYRQVGRNGIFEDGLVVPFSWYASKGGFKGRSITHETRPLSPTGLHGIQGTSMDTSPRRYLARLAAGEAEVWTEGSFTATDDCRDVTKVFPDITHDALEERIFENFEADIQNFVEGIPAERWHNIVFQSALAPYRAARGQEPIDLRQAVEDKLRPRLYLARTVLTRVVKSETLASLVDENMIQGYVDRTNKVLQKIADEERTFLIKLRDKK